MSQVGPPPDLADRRLQKPLHELRLREDGGFNVENRPYCTGGVLFVAHPTLVHAQEATDSQYVQMPERLSPSDLKAITDARIGLVNHRPFGT